MIDFIKCLILTGALEGNFLASFLFGWTVATTVSLTSYPLDTIRTRLMMRSGEGSGGIANLCLEPSNTDLHTLGRQVQFLYRCWWPDPR
jgi:hypothetical protein